MAVGKKVGGRKAGTPNKKTAALRAIVAKGGITPLELMLSNMREHRAMSESLKRRAAATKDEDRKAALTTERLAAMDRAEVSANRAAAYIHPKLQSVMHATDPDNVVKVVHTVDETTLKAALNLIRLGFQQALPAPAKGG